MMTVDQLIEKLEEAKRLMDDDGDTAVEFARGGMLPDGVGEFHSIDEVVVVRGIDVSEDRQHQALVYLVQM